jgi:hypothetical protein
MWFQAVVDRRADTAAANAIASGQHYECDQPPDGAPGIGVVSAPRRSATYRIGPFRSRPAVLQPPPGAFRLKVKGDQGARRLSPLTRERRAGFPLTLDYRQGGTSLVAFDAGPH